MVTFNGAEPGTPNSLWVADPRMAALPQLSLHGVSSIVVIAPHPDDESLGVGGLIAECAARAISVRVVVVTDGGASHPKASEAQRSALIGQRQQEAIAAVAVLAPDADAQFLGIHDGYVRENRTGLHSALSTLFSTLDASTLVIAPWPGDGHRDHRITGEVTREVARAAGLRLLEYPIWLWHWGTPDDPRMPWQHCVQFSLSEPALAAKLHAIGHHRSQVETRVHSGNETAAVLHAEFRHNFERNYEVFIDEGSNIQRKTLGAAYFDQTYARNNDPWGFATRWYEARKRAITLASLPHQRYGRGFEIGCSIGMLTVGLAALVDELLAVDVSQLAVDSARARLLPYPNAVVEKLDAITDYPAQKFDLIVLSEVGYYLAARDLGRLLSNTVASLQPHGTLALCHWRHPVTDYPLSGDEVHEAAAQLDGLRLIAHHSEADFLLDVYSPDGRSVAQQTGLAE